MYLIERAQDEAKKETVSPRKAMALRQLLNTVPTWLRKVKLGQLTLEHCEKYLGCLRPPRYQTTSVSRPVTKARTEQSINQYFVDFRSILDKAVKRKLLDQNPAYEVKIGKALGGSPTVAISPDDIMRVGDLRKLLQSIAQTESPAIYVCFCVMALTGLRAVEAATLQQRDIDFDDKTSANEVRRPCIRVQRYQACASILSAAPPRVVDMSPRLEAILRQWLPRTTGRPKAWLFPASKKGPLPCLSYLALGRTWKRALRKIGFHTSLPLRSLRDSYAVHLIDRGENLVYLSQQLGYKLVDRTAKRYDPWLKKRSLGKARLIHQNLGLAPRVPLPHRSPESPIELAG